MFRSLIGFMLLVATPLFAQTRLDSLIPKPTPFVTDAAHIFSGDAITKMNDIARTTQKSVGGDIAVLTLPSIGDFSANEVALTAGRNWKVGGKAEVGSEQRNLGVVILIVPKTSDHKGSCYVATGNGAEGFITDATAGELCRDNIPLMKEGNYSEAAINMVSSVSGWMTMSVHPPTPKAPEPFDWTPVWVLGTVFGLGFIVFLIVAHYNRKREEEEARINAELWRKEQEEYRRQAAELERQRKEAADRERRRWEALTPEQQAAEIAERKRQQKLAEEEAERARKRRQEEEETRRNTYTPSYSSPSYDYGSSSSTSYSSGDSFGGGGGFSGGGGGSDF